MNELFLSVLNMSLTGAFIIAAICLARLPLKKAPKIVSYCLWAVAEIRLVFPFSIGSVYSLIPFKAQTIPPDLTMRHLAQTLPVDSGIPLVNNAVGSFSAAATPTAIANPLQIWTTIGAYVWLAGAAVLLVYGIASFFILKRKIGEAAHIEANIFEADNISSPFVLGIIRPRIYLPPDLSEQEKSYIILHEKTHIRRHDHIIKFAAYFVLCLHWFNPLAWVAFLLMGVDMEMSCDERVLKEMGGETKRDYSLSLLSLATKRRVIGGSPLMFGEGGIKERIKNVLNFKKTSRVVIALAVSFALVLSMGFLGNRKDGAEGGQSGSPQDDTQTRTLTATLHVPFSSINTTMLEVYADEVKKATNGRVEIQVFSGGILASGPSALEAVTNNTVDIAWCFSTFWSGQFPLADIVAQPMLGVKNADQATNTLWDLYEKYDELKQEMDTDYKILQLYSNPPNLMYFESKRVDSIEALRNIPLRVPAGPVSEIFDLWGANPIFMGPGDAYEALEKGGVDGYVLEYSGMRDFNLQEYTKYYVDMNILSGPFMLIMNKEVWDSFPQDIKDQIDSVSGRAASVKAARMFDERNEECKALAQSQYNIEEINLSPEEYNKFEAIATEYNEEWIERYTAPGFDARAYMDDAIAFLAKYA